MGAGRGRGGTAWNQCTGITDFPWLQDVSLAPGAELKYQATRVFPVAGVKYLAQVAYAFTTQDWHMVGKEHSFEVSEGLQVVQPITLSPGNPQIGQAVTAQYTIRNISNQTLTLPLIGIVSRGPNCSSWTCDNRNVDFPVEENVILPPGATHTYSEQRHFDAIGGSYIADAALGDRNPWWYVMPGNERIDFTVLGEGDAATVWSDSGTLAPSGTLTIPVNVRDLPADRKLGSATVEVHYDPLILAVNACVTNPAKKFDLVSCNFSKPGIVRLSAISSAGVGDGSVLAQIEWKAAKAEGMSALDVQVFTFTDIDGVPISVIDQDGEVSITQYMVGDVTCDSGTSSVDALFILQHEVGMRGVAQQCPLPANTLLLPACDVNGDGACNAVDALFVLQCDVGIPNSFCLDRSRLGRAKIDAIPFSPLATAGTLEVGSEVTLPGTSIEIPIVATMPEISLGAATVEIRYDPSVFTVTECKMDESNLFDSSICNMEYDKDGTDTDSARFSVLSTRGVSGTIQLATLTLLVGQTEQVSQLVPVIVTLVDPSGSPFTLETTNGEVQITSNSTIFLPNIER